MRNIVKKAKIKFILAQTASNECVLGASISTDAGIDNLEIAYKIFKQEAENVLSSYKPETVNIDGWNATKSAWKRCIHQFLSFYVFYMDLLRYEIVIGA